MDESLRVLVTSGDGGSLQLTLLPEADRYAATIAIEGIWYHFERIPAQMLATTYRVDQDADYLPQSDAEGFVYIIAPYSR